VLAAFSIVAGYQFFAGHFFEFPHGEEHGWTVPALASGVFVVGLAIAWAIYSGKQKDPISIPLLARKFYFDELYAGLIRWTQDLLAQVARWVDRWILDAGIVRGLSGAAWAVGFGLRFLQMGNLQGYALIFGLGVVALIYFVLFS
jgi:NADH-quinone oxidoreductase subunit L